jgi:hypothetical protein
MRFCQISRDEIMADKKKSRNSNQLISADISCSMFSSKSRNIQRITGNVHESFSQRKAPKHAGATACQQHHETIQLIQGHLIAKQKILELPQ